MRSSMLFALVLGALLSACSLSHRADADADSDAGSAADAAAPPDVAPPDAALPDEADPPPVVADPGELDELCRPHEFLGCGHAQTQWFWDGSDCVDMHECVGLGSPTYRSCLEDHLACDPSIELDTAPYCPPRRTVVGWGELEPEGVCLRDRVVYAEQPSRLYFVDSCAGMDCAVEVTGTTIELTLCGRESTSCSVLGSSVACEIPALGAEGRFTVEVNGVERFEVMSYDSRIALERGCFCAPLAPELDFEQDHTDFALERDWEGLGSLPECTIGL